MVTVRDVFEVVDQSLSPARSVGWGAPVGLELPGVYVVATSRDANDDTGPTSARISDERVEELLAARPELLVDGARPTRAALVARIESMWVPNETIVYIGMSTGPVGDRVADYYKTTLGARAPHAGGWPIKTLVDVDRLTVFAACCPDPEAAEQQMLAVFERCIGQETRARLCDPIRVMPFANLEYPKGTRKRHGITGARKPRNATIRSEPSSNLQLPPPAPSPQTGTQSQRVTAKDIGGGRIRMPLRSKRVLPSTSCRVSIEIRGMALDARWDPRNGPDRERSGVLTIPRSLLASLVSQDEVLVVDVVNGVVRLR